MEQTDSVQMGVGRGMVVERKGEGIRTCMNDPWTQTTVWGLTVGAGAGGAGQRKAKGEKLGQQ